MAWRDEPLCVAWRGRWTAGPADDAAVTSQLPMLPVGGTCCWGAPPGRRCARCGVHADVRRASSRRPPGLLAMLGSVQLVSRVRLVSGPSPGWPAVFVCRPRDPLFRLKPPSAAGMEVLCIPCVVFVCLFGGGIFEFVCGSVRQCHRGNTQPGIRAPVIDGIMDELATCATLSAS